MTTAALILAIAALVLAAFGLWYTERVIEAVARMRLEDHEFHRKRRDALWDAINLAAGAKQDQIDNWRAAYGDRAAEQLKEHVNGKHN